MKSLPPHKESLVEELPSVGESMRKYLEVSNYFYNKMFEALLGRHNEYCPKCKKPTPGENWCACGQKKKGVTNYETAGKTPS